MRIMAEQEAQAIKIKAQAEAESIKLKALAEAESKREVGLAEAETIKAKALAEAEGIDRKADAMKKYGEGAILEMYFKALPEIAKMWQHLLAILTGSRCMGKVTPQSW